MSVCFKIEFSAEIRDVFTQLSIIHFRLFSSENPSIAFKEVIAKLTFEESSKHLQQKCDEVE